MNFLYFAIAFLIFMLLMIKAGQAEIKNIYDKENQSLTDIPKGK